MDIKFDLKNNLLFAYGKSGYEDAKELTVTSIDEELNMFTGYYKNTNGTKYFRMDQKMSDYEFYNC